MSETTCPSCGMKAKRRGPVGKDAPTQCTNCGAIAVVESQPNHLVAVIAAAKEQKHV